MEIGCGVGFFLGFNVPLLSFAIFLLSTLCFLSVFSRARACF